MAKQHYRYIHTDENGKRHVKHGFKEIAERAAEPPAEDMARKVRVHRNALLAATDFTQLADAPVADAAGWQTYRQALRDLPEQEGFPHNVTWPVPPT